jgi:(4-(4-[2-(gamma-L-glutamylamino)ethyl]phenoxymethyl)furan-2-yl)methanamine synthase
MILGLDIGGANTKASSADGQLVESVYLPLWREAPLDKNLKRLAGMKPQAVGVVITGELADCYQSKAEGIASIKAAVERAFACLICFWGVNGFDWHNTMELAAANWSASASLVLQDFGDCLFVDMGSTTTDLIPIIGKPLAASTDYHRLINGELVYTGMLRTSLGSLLCAAEIEGCTVPLSPEFFAITADAYLVTGWITADQYTCDTPDGSGKDRASALRRLARTVCADMDEISRTTVTEIAQQACDCQLQLVHSAIERQSQKHSLDLVVAAGIGEKIIAQACDHLGLLCTSISEKYGPLISNVFPAYAVAKLLENHLSRPSSDGKTMR